MNLEAITKLFRAGLIDAATFAAIYRYRMINIYANERVRVEKLERNAPGWERFLSLMDRMGITKTKREFGEAA